MISLDPKTQLNQFCQKYVQRPVTKEDIAYSSKKIGYLFQSTVKLNCIDGREFAGELKTNLKDAEKAAAYQAVVAHESTIASLPATNKKAGKKRKGTVEGALNPVGALSDGSGSFGLPAAFADATAASAAAGEPAAKAAKVGEPNDNPAMTDKVRLNSLCMRIVKRALVKGDTLYECVQMPGGFQATVKLRCLPGEWSQAAWAGEVCSTKALAEQTAAKMALETLSNDTELSELAVQPSSALKRQWMKGYGCRKGWGKGWGKGWYGFGGGCGYYDWAATAFPALGSGGYAFDGITGQSWGRLDQDVSDWNVNATLAGNVGAEPVPGVECGLMSTIDELLRNCTSDNVSGEDSSSIGTDPKLKGMA